ncbi:MAG TPA: glycosyltransferase, partial [Prosthecobacter sp.]|nr:glycosyltransferase [Prosthecobacter sp.]
MRIAMMSASISRAAGGIYEIERRLSQELARHSDVSIGVFGTRDEFTDDDLPQWAPLQPQAFATKGPRAFGYAPGLLPALEDWRADLAHLHSLWMHPSVVVRQWAARGNRPTVITANGMLEPSALNHSRWKKRAALLLFE